MQGADSVISWHISAIVQLTHSQAPPGCKPNASWQPASANMASKTMYSLPPRLHLRQLEPSQGCGSETDKLGRQHASLRSCQNQQVKYAVRSITFAEAPQPASQH